MHHCNHFYIILFLLDSLILINVVACKAVGGTTNFPTSTVPPSKREHHKKLPLSRTIWIPQGERSLQVSCPISDADSFTTIIWLMHKAHMIISRVSQDHSDIGAFTLHDYYHDSVKYHYEHSTGDLIINNLTLSDIGIYRCIVQLKSNASETGTIYKAATVELKANEKTRLAMDTKYMEYRVFKGNTTRALITAGCAFLLLVAATTIYSCRWKPGRDGVAKLDSFELKSTDKDTISSIEADSDDEDSSRKPRLIRHIPRSPTVTMVPSSRKIFVIPEKCERFCSLHEYKQALKIPLTSDNCIPTHSDSGKGQSCSFANLPSSSRTLVRCPATRRTLRKQTPFPCLAPLASPESDGEEEPTIAFDIIHQSKL